MQPINILIADDEDPARNRMVRLLEGFEFIGDIFKASNGEEALNIIMEKSPDLAFLDIEMPEFTGLEVAAQIPKDHHTKIIFATAYNDFAIQAFEHNAIDYLLKPINKERLEKCFEKYELMQQVNSKKIEEIANSLNANGGLQLSNKIPIPTADRYKLLDVNEIICVEISERICYVYTKEKKYMLTLTLEQIEKKLPHKQFVKVNRATIINLNEVTEFIIWFGQRFKIMLSNQKEIISSREKSKFLKHLLDL